MGWFIAYLISAFVVPTIFMMFWVLRRDYESFLLKDPVAVFCVAVFCVFWPLTISATVLKAAIKAHKTSITNRASQLMYQHDISKISLHDRSDITVVPEDDLKFLLKNHRKNHINLNKTVVELIRDELMHRNAERDLLK